MLGKWVINKRFKLQGNPELVQEHKTDDFGELYIQARFFDKDSADKSEAEMLYDLEKDIFYKGFLHISIPFALGLRIADRNSSDPFCKIHIPGGEEQRTKVVNSNLNPKWDYYAPAKVYILKEVFIKEEALT